MAAVRGVWYNFKTLNRLCLVVMPQSKTIKSFFSYDFASSQLFHRNELRFGGIVLIRRTTSVLPLGSARTRFVSSSMTHGLKSGQEFNKTSKQSIKAKQVRLIDQEGKNLGIMALETALEVGNERNCKVIEVGTSGSETVCKLISEKQLYDKMKEEKKKHVKTTKTKEIKVTGKICDHDLDIKVKKIREFIEGHNSVKIFVAHRKRQNTSLSDKQAVIDKIAKQIDDVGCMQGDTKPVGNGLKCIFIPHRK